jgi:hypothetical protein
MTELALDIAGHFGYAFIALGMFLIAQKSKWGFASRFTGEVIWLIVGWLMQMSSIWTWGLLFLVIDGYGFIKWSREQEPVETTYGEFKRKAMTRGKK